MYLPNSSLFSKIGSDIISSGQLNFNNQVGSSHINGNPNKKTQHIPSVIVQNYNKTPLHNNNPNSKINFNSLNSILNSNLGVSYKDKASLSPLGKEKKYLTNVGNIANINRNSNLSDQTNKKVIPNKILEKSNSSNELTQSIQSQDKVHNRDTNVSKDIINMNMIDHLSEGISNLNMDFSINRQQLENVISISDDVVERHAYLWEFLFELEFHSDNKSMLVSTSKNIIYKYEEFVRRNVAWEIFNNNSLNKTYTKIIKLAIIIMIYYKFVLLDFNFETNIKGNLKKIATNINEQLIIFLETFVLIKETLTEKLSKEFMDKYSKCIKTHKTKKTKESLNNMSCLNIFKNLEVVINNVKQFSNNFFKIGYFKPIHTICFDLFKSIESMNLNSLTNLVVNHVLFYPLNMHRDVEKRNGISNKALIFSPVSFLGVSNHSQTPFLPPVGGDVYTLFLDLDETLVHFFFVSLFYLLRLRQGVLSLFVLVAWNFCK